MATSTTEPYQTLRSDLAGTVRSTRSDCPPGETARVLLASDTATTDIVGISYDGARVVFHDRTTDQVVACRYDAEGLIGGSGVRLAHLDDGSSIARWVRAMGQTYWSWLHPRYRPGEVDP